MLTVEDGTIVAGADSYISLADARLYAEKYGIILDADDTKAEISLRNAGRYLNSKENTFQGSRVSSEQLMSFPRSGVYSNSYPILADSIPVDLLCAQVEASALITSGINPFATSTGKETASEAVSGAVSVSYFESGKADDYIELTSALTCIYPLTLSAIGQGGAFSVGVMRG